MHRALIVGLGRIAWQFDEDSKRNYISTHAAAYSKNPAFQLTAAADMDSAKREGFSKRYPNVSTYSDYREAIECEKPDVVSICTPPATHFEILADCLKRNIPVVFCEKPILRDASECKKIRKIASNSKSTVCVNHSRRWDPLHRDVFEQMQDGSFGALQNFQAYYTAGLFNTGAHLFDLLQWFFGRPEKVSGVLVRDKADPDVSAFFKYPKGVSGAAFALNVQDYLIFEIDAYFTKGRVRILESGKRVRIWQSAESPNFSGYRELQEMTNDRMGLTDMMANAVSNIGRILDGGDRPFCGLEEGLKVIEWLERTLESARSEKEITI